MNRNRFTYKDSDILQAQQNAARNAAKRFVPVHVYPIDDKHQITVWHDVIKGTRYYIPQYSRTGRTWADYTRKGVRVSTLSYDTALHHIQRGKDTN